MRTTLTRFITLPLAAAAGLSEGTLYNYFRNKTDLVIRACLAALERCEHGAAPHLGCQAPQQGSISFRVMMPDWIWVGGRRAGLAGSGRAVR